MGAERTRHAVATVDELPEDGSRVLAEVGGREVGVFRVDDEFHAVANYCTHQAGPLCEGALEGRITPAEDGWDWDYGCENRTITCPWHGWKFDVTSGANVKDESIRVPTYDVEVEDGTVYVLR